jgi:proteasome lid subunit RPN8/RPN11
MSVIMKPVNITRSVIDSVLSYAKGANPSEAILLLTGNNSKERLTVDGVEIPPLAVHGIGFSNFPLHMLPIDFSIVGTAHSHPSGVLQPSVGDLNNFYGRIMMITAYPYESEQDIIALDGRGERVQFTIIENP